MTHTAALVAQIEAADQDFEWYPTTARMIAAVARKVPEDCRSIMDIGAGDGRVLMALQQKAPDAELYAIEKAPILLAAQPIAITPVGVDFHEQNLSSLPADLVFSNPPYSEYEIWATRIVATAYAKHAYLVLPQRWKDNAEIARALQARGATARVIHTDDFEDAERRARAVIDIVEVSYPMEDRHWNARPVDPFDQWFDQHISTFDVEAAPEEEDAGVNLARIRGLTTIADLVDAYNEDYDRMERNYRAIFTLDYAILRELGVSKQGVRDGLKKRMAGLKTVYWQQLFDRLHVITNRLSTATKKHFLARLTGRASVAFTVDNAHAIVLWAIRHANVYFDEQLVTLFKALATFEGVSNYKSNQRTWEKSGWRYNAKDDQFSHYALDYRIVLGGYRAIHSGDSFGRYEYPGDLHQHCHEQIDDVVAVFGNLGFFLPSSTPRSRVRQWRANSWQDFHLADGRVLFQVKGFQNGNLHWRFLPEAMRAFNIEAGRLLGWLHGPADVERELGYSADEAQKYFGSTGYLLPAAAGRLLTAGTVPALETS